MQTVKKLKCPPHHWVIDNNEVGRCIRPGCHAVMDFGQLQEKAGLRLKLASQRGQAASRGKPRTRNRRGWPPKYG